MNDNNMQQQPAMPPIERGDTSVMSTKDWVVTYLILMIPCVGFIMSIVWAFSSDGNLNRRNYCRAYLIVTAIITVIVIILYALIFAAMFAAMDSMMMW